MEEKASVAVQVDIQYYIAVNELMRRDLERAVRLAAGDLKLSIDLLKLPQSSAARGEIFFIPS